MTIHLHPGVWWSFISMTTVGYGDKYPVSISARLFAIVWIFVGITTFSLVTAMLSSTIVETNSPPTPSMAGFKVRNVKFGRVSKFDYCYYSPVNVQIFPKISPLCTATLNKFNCPLVDLPPA